MRRQASGTCNGPADVTPCRHRALCLKHASNGRAIRDAYAPGGHVPHLAVPTCVIAKPSEPSRPPLSARCQQSLKLVRPGGGAAAFIVSTPRGRSCSSSALKRLASPSPPRRPGHQAGTASVRATAIHPARSALATSRAGQRLERSVSAAKTSLLLSRSTASPAEPIHCAPVSAAIASAVSKQPVSISRATAGRSESVPTLPCCVAHAHDDMPGDAATQRDSVGQEHHAESTFYSHHVCGQHQLGQGVVSELKQERVTSQRSDLVQACHQRVVPDLSTLENGERSFAALSEGLPVPENAADSCNRHQLSIVHDSVCQGHDACDGSTGSLVTYTSCESEDEARVSAGSSRNGTCTPRLPSWAQIQAETSIDDVRSLSISISPRNTWTLANIPEHDVWKHGLLFLHEECVLKPGVDVMEMPRRPDGLPLILQASFFQRLLRGQQEIKCCTESDISAAQLDLRRLSAEQLLTLRADSTDFRSDSTCHVAHNSFLCTLDTCISEKGVNSLLGKSSTPSQPWETSELPATVIQSLGYRVLLTFGAATLLAKQHPAQAENQEMLPGLWLVDIDSGEQSHEAPTPRMALLHVRQLWMQLLPPNYSREVELILGGNQVVSVADASFGYGKARSFRWDIRVVTSMADEFAKIKPAVPELRRNLSSDLAGAFERRRVCAPSASTAPIAAVDMMQRVPRPLLSFTSKRQVAASSDGDASGAVSVDASAKNTGCHSMTELSHVVRGKVADVISRMEANGLSREVS